MILPGVGAFGSFMQGLRERGLVEPLQAAVQRGDPLLGICVGMQALFDISEEMGEHAGLGLLGGGWCVSLISRPQSTPYRLEPALVYPSSSPLFTDLAAGRYAYFNHSYYCATADPADAAARTDYGIDFTSAVQHGNLFGVQFHPEKSQRVGLAGAGEFLQRLIRACIMRNDPVISSVFRPSICAAGQVVRLKEGDPDRQTDYRPDPADGPALDRCRGDLAARGQPGWRIWRSQAVPMTRLCEAILAEADQGRRHGPVWRRPALARSHRSRSGTGRSRPSWARWRSSSRRSWLQALARWGAERVGVSLDARDGRVQVRGWQSDTPLLARGPGRELAERGLRWLVFTDIARDGLQTGLNLAATVELAQRSGLR